MVRRTFRILALGLGLLVPGAAVAATSAVVTSDLNIRTGPASRYQRYGTIPAGDEVLVYGCLRGYNWCDVGWEGERGWVHGAYLAYGGRRYYREPIPRIAVRIGVPVYGFDPYDYHRRYYAGRPWYRDRYLDRDRDFDRPSRDFDGPPRRDFDREARRDRDRDRRDVDPARRDGDFYDGPRRRDRDRDRPDFEPGRPEFREDARDPHRFDPRLRRDERREVRRDERVAPAPDRPGRPDRRGDERPDGERPRKLLGGSAEAQALMKKGPDGRLFLPPQ